MKLKIFLTLLTLSFCLQTGLTYSMHDSRGRFTVPQNADEAAAQNIAIADMKAHAAQAAHKALETKRAAASAYAEAPTDRPADRDKQLTKPKKWNTKERAIYVCTGLPTDIQNLIEQYRLDPMLFLPIIGKTVKINTHCPTMLTQPLPNNRVAVTIHSEAHPGIEIYDTISGKLLCTSFGHTDEIVQIMALDNMLITGSRDTTVRVWDTITGKCLHILRGHTAEITAIAPRPENHIATAALDGSIRIWHLKDGTCVQTLQCNDDSAYLQIINLSKGHIAALISIGGCNKVEIWDPVTGKLLRVIALPDNRALQIKSLPHGHLAIKEDRYTISIWNSDTGKLLNTLNITSRSIDTTPEGSLVTGDGNLFLELWDPLTAKCLVSIPVCRCYESFTLLSNNLVAVELKGCIMIYDLKTWQCQNQFRVSQYPDLNCSKTQMLPDGALLFQADVTKLYIHRPDEESRQLIEKLAETDAYENLIKLIPMLNEHANQSDREYVLEGETGRLYSSLPAEVQEKLKAHYKLAYKPVDYLKDLPESGFSLPCSIL
jgi:hypothetical protein